MVADMAGIGTLNHDDARVMIYRHNPNGDSRKQLAHYAGVPQRIDRHLIGIPRSRKSSTCPVAAFESWLQENAKFSTPADNEPVFRAINHGRPADRLSGQAVAEIVKRAAQRVGLDPAKFAGHSLRSGFATSAARGGADLAFIMQQTGHKSADVALRYVQAGMLLQNPASKAVKL
jgi:integrase